MTTYLATVNDGFPRRSGDTQAYCSAACRIAALHEGSLPTTFRDDDSYEFDEACARCGVTVFSPVVTERRVATDDTRALLSRRLMDRYTPGIKEEVKVI